MKHEYILFYVIKFCSTFRALILWVNRAYWLWGIQVTVATISLTETLLLTYLGYKVSNRLLILNVCVKAIPDRLY